MLFFHLFQREKVLSLESGKGGPAEISGQVPDPDAFTICQRHCPLNDVFQLADIAGIIIVQQDIEGLGGDLPRLLVEGQAEFLDKMGNQQRDIVFSLGKFRQARW